MIQNSQIGHNQEEALLQTPVSCRKNPLIHRDSIIFYTDDAWKFKGEYFGQQNIYKYGLFQDKNKQKMLHVQMISGQLVHISHKNFLRIILLLTHSHSYCNAPDVSQNVFPFETVIYYNVL